VVIDEVEIRNVDEESLRRAYENAKAISNGVHEGEVEDEEFRM
jgi:hypothetical protein